MKNRAESPFGKGDRGVYGQRPKRRRGHGVTLKQRLKEHLREVLFTKKNEAEQGGVALSENVSEAEQGGEALSEKVSGAEECIENQSVSPEAVAATADGEDAGGISDPGGTVGE